MKSQTSILTHQCPSFLLPHCFFWCNLMKIKFIECKCVFVCIIIMVKCFFLSCTNCLYLMKYEIYIATNLYLRACVRETTLSLLYLRKYLKLFCATTAKPHHHWMLHSLKYSCIIIFRVKSTTWSKNLFSYQPIGIHANIYRYMMKSTYKQALTHL